MWFTARSLVISSKTQIIFIFFDVGALTGTWDLFLVKNFGWKSKIIFCTFSKALERLPNSSRKTNWIQPCNLEYCPVFYQTLLRIIFHSTCYQHQGYDQKWLSLSSSSSIFRGMPTLEPSRLFRSSSNHKYTLEHYYSFTFWTPLSSKLLKWFASF